MPHKLLVIDDEENIREVASLSLELTEGWTVRTANGGSAGTALAPAPYGPDPRKSPEIPGWAASAIRI
jgi:DNA-binding NtrC family response regulator